MSIENLDLPSEDIPTTIPAERIIVAEVVEPSSPLPAAQPYRLRWQLPLVLFLLTWGTTFLVGVSNHNSLGGGMQYALAVMTILTCHEMGHFIQTRRYRVPASLPFFIPIPNLFGTMGAVIAMDPRVPNRKALFDIGSTGPFFGLLPTLICCYFGILHGGQWIDRSTIPPGHLVELGDPLIVQWLAASLLGPAPENHILTIGPVATAGWVGLLITSLNLFPMGQLDGGHILYAILGRRAHPVARIVFAACVVGTIVYWYYWWGLMLGLIFFFGTEHGPTRHDDAPLGWPRTVLGWCLLAFVIIGFAPDLFVTMPGM
jgi:Zn-dependent protease